jgi:hypothetical protein
MNNKQIILKISEDLRNKFKGKAAYSGKSMNKVMITLIEEYVKDIEKKEEENETRKRNIAMYPANVYVDDNGVPLPPGNFPEGYF